MNSIKSNLILVLLFSLGLLISPTLSQETRDSIGCYNLEFVSATRVLENKDNKLSVVLLLTPRTEDAFPPTLGLGLKYIIGANGEENYVNLQDQKGKGSIQIVLYGEDVKEKSPTTYLMVKDKINIEEYEDLLLVVFHFNDKIDLSTEEMSLIYGLWEKEDTNLRIEKKFDFLIETISIGE